MPQTATPAQVERAQALANVTGQSNALANPTTPTGGSGSGGGSVSNPSPVVSSTGTVYLGEASFTGTAVVPGTGMTANQYAAMHGVSGLSGIGADGQHYESLPQLTAKQAEAKALADTQARLQAAVKFGFTGKVEESFKGAAQQTTFFYKGTPEARIVPQGLILPDTTKLISMEFPKESIVLTQKFSEVVAKQPGDTIRRDAEGKMIGITTASLGGGMRTYTVDQYNDEVKRLQEKMPVVRYLDAKTNKVYDEDQVALRLKNGLKISDTPVRVYVDPKTNKPIEDLTQYFKDNRLPTDMPKQTSTEKFNIESVKNPRPLFADLKSIPAGFKEAAKIKSSFGSLPTLSHSGIIGLGGQYGKYVDDMAKESATFAKIISSQFGFNTMFTSKTPIVSDLTMKGLDLANKAIMYVPKTYERFVAQTIADIGSSPAAKAVAWRLTHPMSKPEFKTSVSKTGMQSTMTYELMPKNFDHKIGLDYEKLLNLGTPYVAGVVGTGAKWSVLGAEAVAAGFALEPLVGGKAAQQIVGAAFSDPLLQVWDDFDKAFLPQPKSPVLRVLKTIPQGYALKYSPTLEGAFLKNILQSFYTNPEETVKSALYTNLPETIGFVIGGGIGIKVKFSDLKLEDVKFKEAIKKMPDIVKTSVENIKNMNKLSHFSIGKSISAEMKTIVEPRTVRTLDFESPSISISKLSEVASLGLPSISLSYAIPFTTKVYQANLLGSLYDAKGNVKIPVQFAQEKAAYEKMFSIFRGAKFEIGNLRLERLKELPKDAESLKIIKDFAREKGLIVGGTTAIETLVINGERLNLRRVPRDLELFDPLKRDAGGLANELAARLKKAGKKISIKGNTIGFEGIDGHGVNFQDIGGLNLERYRTKIYTNPEGIKIADPISTAYNKVFDLLKKTTTSSTKAKQLKEDSPEAYAKSLFGGEVFIRYPKDVIGLLSTGTQVIEATLRKYADFDKAQVPLLQEYKMARFGQAKELIKPYLKKLKSEEAKIEPYYYTGEQAGVFSGIKHIESYTAHLLKSIFKDKGGLIDFEKQAPQFMSFGKDIKASMKANKIKALRETKAAEQTSSKFEYMGKDISKTFNVPTLTFGVISSQLPSAAAQMTATRATYEEKIKNEIDRYAQDTARALNYPKAALTSTKYPKAAETYKQTYPVARKPEAYMPSAYPAEYPKIRLPDIYPKTEYPKRESYPKTSYPKQEAYPKYPAEYPKIKLPDVYPKEKVGIYTEKKQVAYAKETFGPGYDVYVKEVKTGRMIKVNSSPVTKERARDIGAYYVRESLSRTFSLKKTSQKAEEDYQHLSIPMGFFQSVSGKLREYKIRNRKPIETPERFIEKTQFALETPAEKAQIKEFQRLARKALG